jgi:hypothetical protein
MFKETCLVAHKWIERSPHIKCLENPRVVVAPAWNHIIMGTQSIKMQQTCIINAWNERWSDYEDFDARIAEIRVAIEKIWWKEFQGLICNFWKVARVNFWTIFRFQGSVWNIVDCCLILDNNRGFLQKFLAFSKVLNYFCEGKVVDHTGATQAMVHGGPTTMAVTEPPLKLRGLSPKIISEDSRWSENT